jgi:hypothetical protein
VHNADFNNQTYDGTALNKKNSILSVNSDVNHNKIREAGKVNIKSNSILRERKKSNAMMAKNHSLPHLAGSDATNPPEVNNSKNRLFDVIRNASNISEIIKRIKPLKLRNNKSRVEEDIFRWCVKRVNCSLGEDLNPYELKKQIFDSTEKNPMTKLRCKSVVPFHLQTKRPPIKSDMD